MPSDKPMRKGVAPFSWFVYRLSKGNTIKRPSMRKAIMVAKDQEARISFLFIFS